MTIAERWIREGEERAKKRIEAQARQDQRRAALKMYQDGLDLEQISDYTQLTVTELIELTRPKASPDV